ncbi:uncharacterized protein VTP21DRAFT_1550 [Calcarisporiella thermophila]|uniref:uncharacterized protein n=1 Tax=Calcarisporiella thermophila TaxID=911321 RepID=UPI003743EBB7
MFRIPIFFTDFGRGRPGLDTAQISKALLANGRPSSLLPCPACAARPFVTVPQADRLVFSLTFAIRISPDSWKPHSAEPAGAKPPHALQEFCRYGNIYRLLQYSHPHIVQFSAIAPTPRVMLSILFPTLLGCGVLVESVKASYVLAARAVSAAEAQAPKAAASNNNNGQKEAPAVNKEQPKESPPPAKEPVAVKEVAQPPKESPKEHVAKEPPKVEQKPVEKKTDARPPEMEPAVPPQVQALKPAADVKVSKPPGDAETSTNTMVDPKNPQAAVASSVSSMPSSSLLNPSFSSSQSINAAEAMQVSTTISPLLIAALAGIGGVAILSVLFFSYARYRRRCEVTTALLVKSVQEFGEHEAAETKPKGVYIVTGTYTPTLGDELRVEVGERIAVLTEFDDGWVQGIRIDKDNMKGVLPRRCLNMPELGGDLVVSEQILEEKW